MVLTAWSAGYHFDALTCPPAHLPSPHSKHWREDRLPCLRPTEEQMLPVFERWARVVALAEVRGAGLDLCMLSACHCQKWVISPTTSNGAVCDSKTRLRWCLITPALHSPFQPPCLPQDVPLELAAEQARSPACSELVTAMTELLASLVSLSHLDDAGPQQVGAVGGTGTIVPQVQQILQALLARADGVITQPFLPCPAPSTGPQPGVAGRQLHGTGPPAGDRHAGAGGTVLLLMPC